MNYSDFIGEVQHRLEMGTQGEAVRATRAVLETLGERLQEGEASDLAGPLPMEIDYYLESADHGQRFDYDEFISRVAERENMNPEDDDDRPEATSSNSSVPEKRRSATRSNSRRGSNPRSRSRKNGSRSRNRTTQWQPTSRSTAGGAEPPSAVARRPGGRGCPSPRSRRPPGP
ncbi:hypothetical protein BRD15_00465 [Halobacteriales archaeon SW_6_65_15]|nr:MAG: hypothetical protein BRD15_00465 [Halobacteriales archaeon SW_6_65_15]